MNYLRKASRSIGTPPQTEPLDSKQVPNSAGGFSYQVDCWKQLERFLILGSEGGTYYVSEQKLTGENVKSLQECLKLDGVRAVELIAEISHSGRAPKNDAALFALAYCMCTGDEKTRSYAAGKLPDVARTGTHLFHFVQFAQEMRGWGRVLKDAVAAWYIGKRPEHFGEQAIKYRQRDGWSHRDLLRLSHPKFREASANAVAKWVVKGESQENLPSKVQAHIELQACTEPKVAAALVEKHELTWESVPTELLNAPVVWEALLQKMPLTAMIRNLGKMSSIGVLKPLSLDSKMVSGRLREEGMLKRARVHPINILNALRTYQRGHGEKGKLSWTPVPGIVDALDDAFYLAFKTIEPSNKNFFLGLDVSGSMSSPINGMSISCCEGTAVMAMVTARKEPNYYVRGFCDRFVDLGITAKDTLHAATRKAQRNNFGSTDCSLPMVEAAQEKLDVDVFCVYTDNETYAGRVHPKQALDIYRQKFNKNAKLVVVGMCANKFSIADATDFGMLDVTGFDTATPALISEFAR